MNNGPRHNRRTARGIALLMVLLMIMAVTILSLGYVARSDIDLAVGQNMSVRFQLDQLAGSGLEHARGLILNPQDVSGEYWTGDTGLQLDVTSQNFYDVVVEQDPNDYCNYTITSSAYRFSDGQKNGLSELSSVLRLDPCVALWIGDTATIFETFAVTGDVYCGGSLANSGTIDGDVFSNGLSGVGPVTGSDSDTGDLSLAWPSIDSTYTHPDYSSMSIGPGTITDTTYATAAVRYCSGDLTLGDDVIIEGMLLVEGDLTIAGDRNTITAAKNLPALYVSGDLTIDDVSEFTVQGLAVVDGSVWVGAAASNVKIVGSLFSKTAIRQSVPDSSGNNNDIRMYGDPTWQTAGGKDGGGLAFDGSDDYLQDLRADAYLNGLTAITISVWVRSDVTGRDRGIFYTRDPGSVTPDRCLGLRYDRNGAFGGEWNCIKASVNTWPGGSTQIESSGTNQTSDWQHLVLVWSSGQSLKLYIGGSYDSPSYDAGAVTGWIDSCDRLLIGTGSYGNLWDGSMDEFRVYGRELSPLEIAELYANPAGGTTVGLLARYTLDEDGPGVSVIANPTVAAIETADEDRWSPAAGAFFRTIER